MRLGPAVHPRRRERPAVPADVRGRRTPGVGRRRAVRHEPGPGRQPRRAGAAARRRASRRDRRRSGSSALEAASVPCSPIRTMDEVFASPEGAALVDRVDDPARGTSLPLVANPLRFDGAAAADRAPAAACSAPTPTTCWDRDATRGGRARLEASWRGCARMPGRSHRRILERGPGVTVRVPGRAASFAGRRRSVGESVASRRPPPSARARGSRRGRHRARRRGRRRRDVAAAGRRAARVSWRSTPGRHARGDRSPGGGRGHPGHDCARAHGPTSRRRPPRPTSPSAATSPTTSPDLGAFADGALDARSTPGRARAHRAASRCRG